MKRIRGVSKASVLALLLIAGLGCSHYSKEQQQEIDAIKARVDQNPSRIDLDDGSGTPLEVAALNGYLELARWLVDRHANVNARDHEDGTVLHRAVVEDHRPDLPMLHFLLSSGASVDMRRRGVETALHVAVSLGRTDVAKLLLEHGADVHARGFAGQTPLHLASFPQGYPEAIKMLLAHGADINERQNNRATALHLAAMGHNIAVVELLLSSGAIPTLADATGQTALHYAAQSGNSEAAARLLDHGADVNAQDFEGHTPLWLALHQPAVTAGPGYSGPVSTSTAVDLLQQHGGRP